MCQRQDAANDRYSEADEEGIEVPDMKRGLTKSAFIIIFAMDLFEIVMPLLVYFSLRQIKQGIQIVACIIYALY